MNVRETLWQPRLIRLERDRVALVMSDTSAIDKRLAEAEQEVERLCRRLKSVPGLIIQLKFINGWSERKVAEKLNYSPSQISRISTNAIKKLEKEDFTNG